jgi:tetratricopeptide (TPR) repeat protein
MAEPKSSSKSEKKSATPSPISTNESIYLSIDQEALTKDPDFKALNEVIMARKSALFQTARDRLQALLNKRPEWIPARKELLMLYMATESYTEAETFLINECKRIPNDGWLHVFLANVYKRLGNIKKEIQEVETAIKIKYDEQLLRRLFELQRDSGDLEGALNTVLSLRARNDNLQLEIAHAKLLVLLKRHDEALKISEDLIKKEPNSKEVIETWLSNYLASNNKPEVVVDKFEPMVKKGTKIAAIYAALGQAYHRMEKQALAIENFTEALKMESQHAQWWYDLSLCQRQIGLLEESQASLKKSIELNPLNASALRVFGVEHKYTEADEMLRKIHYAHACIDKFSDERKVELYFALAKAFEDINQLPTAFKYYENAGNLQKKITPYRHAGSLSVLRMTRDRVGPKTYEQFSLPRCESEKPLFILGMPRSGTSLVEQVISSHPDVYGAGELKLLHRVLDGISINKRTIETKVSSGVVPTYIPGIDLTDTRKLEFKDRGELYVKAIEAIAASGNHKDAKRVIDKMPGNYFWTGVIPFVLPKAKIIHTQRHPLDNCLSLYRIFFPDGMPWSYDLVNLGKVYKAYYEHMKYWEKNLPPGMMLTLNYEVTVVDFERQARKIIDHVGLEWNDNCLRFYENERNVKTASLSQVRKPIYNTSVGRWKKYEEFLQPLIKELGPLVEEYESMIETKIKELK